MNIDISGGGSVMGLDPGRSAGRGEGRAAAIFFLHVAGRSGMAEAQQLCVQKAIDSMVQGLEREIIRKMQGIMFRCSATCCENNKASMQQGHQGIECCHAPLAQAQAQAQAVVTQELERFQDCLACCTMHCNDKAKDLDISGSGQVHI